MKAFVAATLFSVLSSASTFAQTANEYCAKINDLNYKVVFLSTKVFYYEDPLAGAPHPDEHFVWELNDTFEYVVKRMMGARVVGEAFRFRTVAASEIIDLRTKVKYNRKQCVAL